MEQMSLDRVEDFIRHRVDIAVGKGWRFLTHNTGTETKFGCVLGACMFVDGVSDMSANTYAMNRFGWSADDAWSFISGFDNGSNGDKIRNLGAKFRKELNPKDYHSL